VTIVLVFLVVAAVLAVAATLVVREAGRLAKEPLPPVFDVEEAFDWVVQHVPDDVAATLTPADVRRILDFQVEFLTQQGVAGNGHRLRPPDRVVVGATEAVDYIVRRSGETGEEYLPEQVHAVIETQIDYLRAIGAIPGSVADDLDDEDGAPWA
jgi:hypothetical protein